jgi:predicted ATPase
LAEPGELIIIDEPEMNLHPEAQVKIIEFLAALVNAGLRVLITTHSPYILDHLSNLIRAAEYEKEDQIPIMDQFFLERSDAFISQDDISIYLFEHGEVENMLKDGKIDWGTFGDVSDRVAIIHYGL